MGGFSIPTVFHLFHVTELPEAVSALLLALATNVMLCTGGP